MHARLYSRCLGVLNAVQSLQNQLQSRPYFEVGNKEPRYFRDVNSVDRYNYNPQCPRASVR